MQRSLIFLLAIIISLSSAHKGQRAPLEQARHYRVTKDLKIIEIDPRLSHLALEDPETVVVASYLDHMQESGWLYLTANTSSNYPDTFQALAAGYFEGYQAYEYIYFIYNNEGPYVRGPTDQALMDWVAEQRLWYTEMIDSNPNDPFWQLANITVSQLQGIYSGFVDAVVANGAPQYFLTYEEFYLIAYVWDLLDVSVLFDPAPGQKQEKNHCSFLLKLVEDDLYVSHTSWAWYEIMTRMFKSFNWGFTNPAIKNKQVMFSSQPGSVESGDDYYIMSNNKVVSETTLGSSNPASWDFLHTDSVPYFIRINIANFMWETQQQWADVFFSYRAGTYNNQWMVVDFNNYAKYKKNLSEAQDIVWFVEEFYAMTSAQDVTQELLVKQGYAASYNEVYNPVLQEYSMNSDNYTNVVRYFLFQKYTQWISNFEDFQNVMRMNNFTDYDNYGDAIASRFDLVEDSEDPSPFGACDAKATAWSMVPDFQAFIISGPTTELTPAFNWSDWPAYANCSLGQPRVYNFTWQHVIPWNSSQEVLY